MVEQSGSGGRYTAFLSYSHKDAIAARWLHRRLETYRLPRRLAGAAGARGAVPARLTPIFRDREELPAAGDLSETVRAALAASDALIVLCSPHSAISPWVGREISTFRALHPDRPIYAAIVEGDPVNCFQPELLAGGAVEPLAADLRKDGDGRRLGFLKLVAGLAGVGLDALVQRDAQRRLRRVTAVTVGALLGMLVTALLAIFALNARAEAERQRAEAEGLVEFMLTDLRDRLEGVGRLDVLTAVNERALDYYEGQNLDGLPAESLERRARILHAMGEDDEKKGNLDRALTQFQEAARTTATLLAADSENPERIFNHAQSEFWVGSVAYAREDMPRAKRSFQRYRDRSEQLVRIDPDNGEWLKEAGYAEGNLCSVALEPPVDIRAALQTCEASVSRMEAAVAMLKDAATSLDLANRLGWLADALRKAGQFELALQNRRRQLSLTEGLLTSEPRNVKLRARRIWSLRAIANLEVDLGRIAPARIGMNAVAEGLDELVRLDPDNAEWREERHKVEKELITISNKSQPRGDYNGK